MALAAEVAASLYFQEAAVALWLTPVLLLAALATVVALLRRQLRRHVLTPLALRGIAEDVTERLRVDGMLRQRTLELSRANQELMRVARMKDEFLASMSHELRTPLNSVLALAEVLQEDVYGPLNERQRRYLQTIESSGRHLLSLINDVLDVSKIESGHLEVDKGFVNVGELAEASLRLVRQVASRKGIALEHEIRTTAPLLHGDERRLKQVLVNLLANAVKFTPEGGRVGLRVHDEPEAGRIAFTIWDTGIGIAEEHYGRLFQPFMQVDGSLTRGHEGTGLGLTLVRRLTELHDGSVAVESTPGAGSAFTVTLPLGEAEAGDAPPPPAPGARVLLALEASAGNEALARALDAAGWRVTHAADELQALEQTREGGWDALVVDTRHCATGGVGRVRSMRSRAVAGTPLLAVATVVTPGDEARYLQAGADAYLVRPLIPRRLAERLAALIAPRQAPARRAGRLRGAGSGPRTSPAEATTGLTP
jgi:signal transduction histidine kinase/DNA-binding NarL/FixJ family response regulator